MGSAAKAFNPQEFAASVARLREGTDFGKEDPQPKFDPLARKAFVEEVIQKRTPAPYEKVLEAFGFRFYSDQQIAARGLAPTGEGVWRNGRLGLAFQPSDLLGLFVLPEDLDRWLRQYIVGQEMKDKMAGLSKDDRASVKRIIRAKR